MNLKYTLCFIRHADQILMLLRNDNPYAGLFNGIGGKIKPGETPREGALREAFEETCYRPELGIRLETLHFGGIVTWPQGDGVGGMYVYTAALPNNYAWTDYHHRNVDEGRLEWLPEWKVQDLRCPSVVDNIPHFLRPMLAGEHPAQYHCYYDKYGNLKSVERRLLTISLEGVV